MSLDVYLTGPEQAELFSANITHNLNTMAEKAGIYQHLWRPDEIEVTKAAQLIVPLTVGLRKLAQMPEHFMQYNPPNGWGDYEGLVSFVEKYLIACIKNPDAEVSVCR